MTKDFVYILANALAGGIGGYYTNDYAVKMIFRKYWGMGGIIIDTRPQFIANMSKLVERDVLNVNTLAPALGNERSKEVLSNLLTDFWLSMQADAQDMTLGQVAGIDRSTDRLLGFYKTYSQGALSDILSVLLRDIKLKEVLQPKQCEFLATALYNFGLTELVRSSVVRNTLCDYQQQFAQRPITDFLPVEFFEQLADNLADSMEQLPRHIKTEDVEDYLETVVEQTYMDLACDSLLDEFENSLKDKSLFELLGYEQVQGISREFLNNFLAVLQSEQGRMLLDNLAIALFAELKQLNASLYSLLNDGMRKKLDIYLRDTLPWFMERLLTWVELNKPELEGLINNAVEQVLAEDDDLLGLKSEAKKLLKDVFIGDVAAKYELVGKIVGYIQSGADPNKAASELSEYIIWQLKRRKVGDLLTSMEELGLIKANDGGRILLSVLQDYLPGFDLQGLDSLFMRKAGEFVDISLSTYFAQYFKQALKNHLRDEFICAPHSAEYIRLELKDKLRSLSEQKLGYFADAVAAKSLGEQLQVTVTDYLQSHTTELSKQLADNVQLHLQDKRLDWAINSDMQQKLKTYMAEQSFDKLRSVLEEYKTKKLVEIYNILGSKLSPEQLSSFLGMMLTGNLDDFLKGKVEKAVADNLQGLSNEELQTLTENFMGTELQPLSRLGGGMGAGIGGLAAAAGLGTLSSNLAINVVASGMMFAGIGWLTNVIAIQMIFKPYQPREIFGCRVPFTPGIIPRQKPRFAVAMGDFIDQKLFVQERAVADFLGKQEQARDSLLELAYRDDYAWLYNLLRAQHERLSNMALDSIQRNLSEVQDNISAVLQDEFSRLPIGVLDYTWLNQVLATRSSDLFDYGESFLQSKVHSLLYSQTALGATLPEGLKLALRRGVDNMLAAELNVWLERLQDEQQFGMLLDRYSNNFDSFVQRPIGEMLGVERSVQFKHAVHRFALEKLQSEESCKVFYNWLNERLENELQADRTLGEVLNGSLLRLIQSSSGQILTALVERALDSFSAKRENIKQEFHRQFMDSAGLLLRAANMILDIDATIYRTIDRMIDVELKEFAGRKNAELQEIITDFVNHQLSGVRISELGFALNYRQVMELAGKMLQSTHTANALSMALDSLLEAMLSLNIKHLLRISNFRSWQNIYQRFWPEIRVLRYQLANNIHSCHDLLVKRAGNLVEFIFMGSIYHAPTSKVLHGIKEDLLLSAGKRLLDELQHSEVFSRNLESYVKGLEHELRFKSLDQLLDVSLLSRDLLGCLAASIQRKQVRELLLASIHEFIGQLIKNSNEIIKDSTKNYFLKGAITSFVAAMVVHFEDLLKALDIKKVAVQQIEGMSAKNLKLMFDSFAAPYFRRIERYGLIAGLLALVTVPLLAWLK